MKKIISMISAAILLVCSFTACGSNDTQSVIFNNNNEIQNPDKNDTENISESDRSSEDTFQVIATIFPQYDWVNEILGENPADVHTTLLLDTGVDLHSFQPTAEDIMNISNCDMFIYVGGESDEWVEDTLKEAANDEMIVINLLDALGDSAREEEIVEGMQTEQEEDEEGEEEIEYDEHVWLSLGNAEVLCDTIAQGLGQMDPEHAGTYKTNSGEYAKKLALLDEEYRNTVEAAQGRTLLFGDRFPFRYLADDYGLEYYAAFAGCSAETEASFETITFLAQKMDELSLSHVMTIEGTDHRIAETIVQSTEAKNQDILTMDSMQSVTAKDVTSGTSYLALMTKNLEVLREALN